MAEEQGMKPIWYFVGIALLVIGGIIMLTGIYYLFNPGESSTVLAELHPDLWWGAIMVIVGIVFIVKNKDVVVE
mgnify:CR=1 FL=1